MRNLEEYTDLELERELQRRQELRNQGLCSFCEQPFDSFTPCRYHEQQVDGKGIPVIAERIYW